MSISDQVLSQSLNKYFPGISAESRVDKVIEIRERCKSYGIQIIHGSTIPLLSQIYAPPPILYVRGALPRPGTLCIGVVGARRAKEHSLVVAMLFARELAQAGVWVVSGLAYGVDSAAHLATLHVGRTIAVLAHGLDRIYPSKNMELAERIVKQGGALVSEYPPGVKAQKYYFPQRNRILAGLCDGLVVVQASSRSGALITAKFAVEENRELFVCPSTSIEAEYDGSHELIKAGAKFVTCARDVLEEFPLRNEVQTGKKKVRFHRFTLADVYSKKEALAKLHEDLTKGEVLEISPQHFLRFKA